MDMRERKSKNTVSKRSHNVVPKRNQNIESSAAIGWRRHRMPYLYITFSAKKPNN